MKSESLSETQLTELDPLYEQLDILKSALAERVQLYMFLYLGEKQLRRYQMHLEGLNIRQIAEREGVSITAIFKSLFGSNISDTSNKTTSPADKIKDIISIDPQCNLLLREIRNISNQINEII